MIEAKVSWNKENISKYVKFTVSNGKNNKIFFLIYAVVIAIAAIGGIVFAIISSQPWIIIISVLLVAFIFMYFFSTYLITSSYIDKMLKNFDNIKINYIELSNKIISVREDNIERGLISWSSVKSTDFYKDTIFITTENGMIFIISSSDITEGSFDDLKTMLCEKVKKSD